MGNLPPSVTIPQLTEFLNEAMKQLGIASSGSNSVVSAWISSDGHYAFVEFRSIEEANGALMHLNGLQIGSFQLRVGRPKGYVGSSAVQPAMMGLGGMGGLQMGTLQGLLGMGGYGGMAGMSAPMNPMLGMGGVGGMGAPPQQETSNVLMFTNLPLVIGENQIKELLSPFGEVSQSVS